MPPSPKPVARIWPLSLICTALFSRILCLSLFRRSLSCLCPFVLSSCAIAQQRLDVVGMVFAHRREPAFDAPVIGVMRRPGGPGTRIFLAYCFRRRQALRRRVHVSQGSRQIYGGRTRQEEKKYGTARQRHASTSLWSYCLNPNVRCTNQRRLLSNVARRNGIVRATIRRQLGFLSFARETARRVFLTNQPNFVSSITILRPL